MTQLMTAHRHLVLPATAQMRRISLNRQNLTCQKQHHHNLRVMQQLRTVRARLSIALLPRRRPPARVLLLVSLPQKHHLLMKQALFPLYCLFMLFKPSIPNIELLPFICVNSGTNLIAFAERILEHVACLCQKHAVIVPHLCRTRHHLALLPRQGEAIGTHQLSMSVIGGYLKIGTHQLSMSAIGGYSKIIRTARLARLPVTQMTVAQLPAAKPSSM